MQREKNGASVWTGIVDAIGGPGCELIEADCGAFIRVFTWVDGPRRFEERARDLMTHHKISVLGIEDVMPVAPDATFGDEDERDQEALAQANKTHGVIFGTFFTYPLDKA